MIPTRDECLTLMDRCEMMDHIVHHSIEVARVALFLSEELNKHGQRIDLHLVEAASLLHDITKTECFRTKEDHARTGSQLLKALGFGKVGKVVAEHVQLCGQGDPSTVSEEEVVNYADKRVRHDQIVSLRERFTDLKERYGKNPKASGHLEILEENTLAIERKIFSILKTDPDDLQNLRREGRSIQPKPP